MVNPAKQKNIKLSDCVEISKTQAHCSAEVDGEKGASYIEHHDGEISKMIFYNGSESAYSDTGLFNPGKKVCDYGRSRQLCINKFKSWGIKLSKAEIGKAKERKDEMLADAKQIITDFINNPDKYSASNTGGGHYHHATIDIKGENRSLRIVSERGLIIIKIDDNEYIELDETQEDLFYDNAFKLLTLSKAE